MLKVTANNQQIAAHINAAAEQYLVRHSQPGFFKTHTRQGEAQMVLQSVKTFVTHSISAKVLIEDLYRNHIQGKNGELSDDLAKAIRSCLNDDPFSAMENKLSAATGISGVRINSAEVAKKVLNSYYPIEAEKQCVVQ